MNESELTTENIPQEEVDNKKGFIQIHKMEFMISLALHSFMLFLMIVLSSIEPNPLNPEVSIIQKVEEEPKEEQPKKLEQLQPEVKPIEVTEKTEDNSEETVDVPIDQPTNQPDTDTAGESETDLKAIMAGTTGEVADIPEGIVGPNGVGYGSPNGGGLPHGYKSRAKGSKNGSLRKYDGGGTETNVELSLKWLKYHQESDGSWDASKYEGRAPEKEAMTSLALLAFLGSGYSEHVGPYKDTIRRGLSWLNQAVEEKNGKPWFGKGYGTGMVLMALSEATMFSSSSRTRSNANVVAEYVLSCYNGNGWRYNPDDNSDDQSVSGWIALGLKSAKSADLEALIGPNNIKRTKDVFSQYTEWVKSMTSEESGLGSYDRPGDNSPTMTWVGMFQRIFLDFPKQDKYLTKATENSLVWLNTDKWIGAEKPGDVYGIYYGTLVAFQKQETLWKPWNAKMKTTLLGSQRKGDPQAMGGSWDPTTGTTGEIGGRVLTTALFCLCLEIYYRYEMMN